MNNATHALGEYKVGKRIASGGFGYVYGGEAPDGTQVAIKYERTYSRIKRPYLQHEADVYRLLQGNPCVPTVYAYGREERWNMMVFDLLGTSLESLHEKCGDKFSLKTTLMLAPQLIDCIEYCHSKGIIHRDIKPDNFLMGRGDRANLVHIVDFGLARRFRHPKTREHFPWFEGHNFFGTTRFASLHALEGCSQSRRDDLESAAYSLIYFMRGRLPWQGIRGGTDKHRDQRVREKKRNWSPERLCEGLPEEFAQMLTYIKNLEYEDEPDYACLKGLFRDRLEKEGFELDYDYDWLHITDEEDVSDSSLPGGAKSGTISTSKSGTSTRISISSDKVLVDTDDESARSKSLIGHSDQSADSSQLSEVSSSLSVHSEEIAVSIRDEDEDHPSTSDIEIVITKPVEESSSESIHGQSSSDNTTATGSVGSQYPELKPDNSKSATSASNASKSATTISESSHASSEEDPEAPIKKGDIVLIKLLPRDTLEFDDTWTSSRPVDNSYWHNPSLSEDDWHFTWRPAVVTNVDAGEARTRLYVLPIMHRADGLDKISPARRPAFFKIHLSGEAEASSPKVESSDERLEVETTPAWSRDGTYVHHQMIATRVLVSNESVAKVDVVWRLEKQQLKRLLTACDSVKDIIEDDIELSDAGEETQEVRYKQKKHRNMSRFAVFGDIASLTDKTFDQTDVDFKGSNGWLPEFIKIDRRRNEENGWYSGSSDDSDGEDENISCFTGSAPGNRRLSCTLAIDGNKILEASVAGSDRSSVASSNYHSSRGSSYHGSKASSYRSGSSYRSKGSSRRSRAGSPARPLRKFVLDSAARYGMGSRCSSRARSDAGSSRASSLTRSEKSSIAPSSAGLVAAKPDALSTLRYVANSNNIPVPSSDADSDTDSVVISVASSIARSVTSVAGSISRVASSANKKVMVDEAVQTDTA